jgi:hypothetical protein
MPIISTRFVSPTGGGNQNGLSAQNPMRAVSGNLWTTGVTGASLGTCLRFLPGEYVVTGTLTLPNATRISGIFLWGCDSSGNLIETRRNNNTLLLNKENLPIIIASGSNEIIGTVRNWIEYRSLHFKTIRGISDGGNYMVRIGSNSRISGCAFSISNNDIGLRVNSTFNLIANSDFLIYTDSAGVECVTTTAPNSNFTNCIFTGITPSGGIYPIYSGVFGCNFTNCIFADSYLGDAISGVSATSLSCNIDHCLFYNIGNNAIYNEASSTHVNGFINVTNSLFVNVTGFIYETLSANYNNTAYIYGNAFFNIGSGVYTASKNNPTGIITPLSNSNIFATPVSSGYLLSNNNICQVLDMFNGDIGPTFSKNIYSFIG